MTDEPVLALQGIGKHFGSVHALRGADFVLRQGSIHALLGENGAGKTTLMRIAAGLEQPDEGTILLRGRPVRPASPREARRLGIGMVHQHSTSIPAFTVRDNIALAAGWRPARSAVDPRLEDLCTSLGFTLPPGAVAGELTVGQLQKLEIAKALSGQPAVLLLDEPTASLAPGEADEVLRLMGRLAKEGTAVVLITHRLTEAIAHADTVTVLRRGHVVLQEGAGGGWSPEALAAAMLGAAPPARATRQPIQPGAVAVRAGGLTVPPISGFGPGLGQTDFTLRAGEVVGVAAVEGNGERELLRSVAGLVPPGSGTLEVVPPVAIIPEDRVVEGLVPEFTLVENLTLSLGSGAPWVRRGILYPEEATRFAGELLERNQVVAAGPEARARGLSGGNQQKLLLARELARRPRVVVAENPSRGLDVRAAIVAFEMLRTAAAGGAAVLVYSSDLDELITWCDRIVVLHRGQVLSPPPGSSREVLGRYLVGMLS